MARRAHSRLRARLWYGLVVCAALFSVCAAQAQQTRLLLDEWSAQFVMGKKAGYAHEEVTERRGNGGISFVTVRREELAISRGAFRMQFVFDTVIEEDSGGRLISFRQQTDQGLVRHIVEGRVEGGQLVLKEHTGGGVTERRLPAPSGLCPAALRRFRQQQALAPGTTYSVKAFVPEFAGQDVEMRVRVGPKEAVQVYEVTKWLHRVDVELSVLPGVPTSEWVDEDGTAWLARASLGGSLTVESRKATRELALAPDEPADILSASVVRPDRPILNPRELKELELLITPVADAPPLVLPACPFQEVKAVGQGLLVTLRRAQVAPEKSYRLPYGAAEYADLLRPNRWLEANDPLVVDMARQAVGQQADALAAARSIEKHVRETLERKHLGLGLATAAEAAAQKAGDCTEHAVLVAAMARAAGMPSRVVGGLAYTTSLPGGAEPGFAYHMWAEVFVGEWLPLDAALGGHDATHLALARDDLNSSGDLLTISSAISRFFGKYALRVVRAE